MQGLADCPPRHLGPLPPATTKVRFQIITASAHDNEVSWEKGGATVTGPCLDIQNDLYFRKAMQARSIATSNLKRWYRQHAVHLYGRTAAGFSIHVQVHTPLRVAVEFPETHATEKDVRGYFNTVLLETKLNFEWTFSLRSRSVGWAPDTLNPTQLKKYPVALVSFKNVSDYQTAIKYMETHGVPGKNSAPIFVSVWETKDYVKPQQRFILENNLQPGGWVVINNLQRLKWTFSLCDIEGWCIASPENIQADVHDQSICKLTRLCFDEECRNGTAEDRRRMAEVGLDKFPRATEPTHQVLQISCILDMADGRAIRFLLELDDEHRQKCAVEDRLFEGQDYQVRYFGTEPDMFIFFRDLIAYYDPDLIVTFNGDRFDWPYLIARMGERPVTAPYGRFAHMGRAITDRWETKRMPFRTDPKTKIDTPVIIPMGGPKGGKDKEVQLPQKYFKVTDLALEPGIELIPELTGRVVMDLCSLLRDMGKADKDKNFTNYTLNNIAARFLNEQKVYFNHNDIFDAWHGQMTVQRILAIPDAAAVEEVNAWFQPLVGYTLQELKENPDEGFGEDEIHVPLAAQRHLLGDYCIKDSLLPLRILDKLGIVTFLWQVSRVAQTPPNEILNQGQMIRVSTMFIGEAWRQGRYVNLLDYQGAGYQGATVLKPKRGYYGGSDRSCAVLDPQPPLPTGYNFEGITPEDLLQRVVSAVILTLDFKSLYPSIMRQHRLCPGTLKLQDNVPKTRAEQCALDYQTRMTARQAKAEARMEVVAAPPTVVVEPVEEEDQGVEDEEDDNEEEEDLLTDEIAQESGVVFGEPDEAHYTTVRIVAQDKTTKVLTYRYHKFTKHNRGIYPVLLDNLLDGREVYKVKMNNEKMVLGCLEVVWGKAQADDGQRQESEEALDDLRTQLIALPKNDRQAFARQWAETQQHAKGYFFRLLTANIGVYNGRQLALKVMANAIYGVSGAKTKKSPIACCQLAESVTAIGRQGLGRTKLALETQFAEYSPDVVYGDTDSVMVLIAEPDDKKAWAIATAMATYITEDLFHGELVLEDEAIKRLYALFRKKNYVGMENEDVKTGIYKLVQKGVSTVRHDKPEILNILLSKLYTAFTDLGHFPRDVIARMLLRLCVDHFEKLVQNQFPLDVYTISQRINKMSAATVQAHIIVANKMRKRTDMPINRGDSVQYVHIKGSKQDNASTKVEATVFVKTHPEIEIDRAYYLSNKLQGVVSTTLELFLPPEVIAELFITFQQPLDFEHVPTISQALAGTGLTPAQERAQRMEKILNKAIAQQRMPQGSVLIDPLQAKRKRPTKVTFNAIPRKTPDPRTGSQELAGFQELAPKITPAMPMAKKVKKTMAPSVFDILTYKR